MKLTITNTGTVPTTLAAEDLAIGLDPGESTDIDGAEAAVYGPKPGVIDQFKRVGAIIKSLASGKAPSIVDDVSATIRNCGTNPVRVILGDGTTDTTIPAGGSYSASAAYLELRELGIAPQQGGTPD
jgi:hypothetical protein